jgi:arginine utilization protein RocB
VQTILIGDTHGRNHGEDAATPPPSSVRQRDAEPCWDQQTPDSASAWSLLRDTFEYRDFDDSLVFAE